MEVAHYEPRDLVRRLECCARELPPDVKLVLDYAWLWDSMVDKAELLRKLETFNVAWIEDVFPRTEIDLYRKLRSATKLQVGCGDETTRVQDALDLVEREAIDVIRLDATTIGGIRECRRAFSLASRRGVQVSFHEHPEIHQHVILGLTCTDHVEVFPEDRPFDKVCDLWHSDLFNRICDGRISPPADPGTGIRLKEENVRRYATRFGVIEKRAG
jgi:L-fuconate dehydratase